MTDVCLRRDPERGGAAIASGLNVKLGILRKNGTVLMPSSLLLMSGPLPTEVFKILPVVHGGVRGGGRGTYGKPTDNCYYKCTTVVIENKTSRRGSAAESPAEEDGV